MALFSSIPTGLEISTLSVRAAQAMKHGDAVTVIRKVETPLEQGVIVRGSIAKQPALLAALKKVASSLPAKAREVVLCLPLEAVACSWVLVPGTRGAADVSREIEKLLPMERDDVQILTHAIGKLEDHDILAFTALAKQVATQCVALCTQAGLQVIGVTTSSAALAAAAGARSSTLLLRALDASTVLTVFRDGWPIDEELIGLEAKDVDARVSALLQEYAAHSLSIEQVAVIGKTLNGLQTAPLLSWLSPEDEQCAGALCASLAAASIGANYREYAVRKPGLGALPAVLLVLGAVAATAACTFAVLSLLGT